MAEDFEILEHTADVGIIARGETLEQAFINAARGMFSLMAEASDTEETKRRDIELKAADRESLLVAWLNELIYIFDAEGILFSRFEVASLTNTKLAAVAYGERANVLKHGLKMGIKAATYHMLKVEKRGGGYRVQVLLDI